MRLPDFAAVRKLFNRFLNLFAKDKYLAYKVSMFYKDFSEFEKLNTDGRFLLDKKDIYPCLDDNTGTTNFDAHYTYHPAWAARIVKEINPELHVDISSTLHFCSILSAFVKTAFYDYRPASLKLDNLESRHADLVQLPFANDSINSLSCMHTIEHVGLGRYGDPLDPGGDLKAFAELKRVCGVKGNLLIVVPVGVKKLQFNTHRIYDPYDIVKYMAGFELKKFALVDDKGDFDDHSDLAIAAAQQYGCGCFWFVKI